MGQSRPLFVYFCHFLDTISIIQIEKSVDGVLGIQTRGRRMVGADETMEVWRPPNYLDVISTVVSPRNLNIYLTENVIIEEIIFLSNAAEELSNFKWKWQIQVASSLIKKLSEESEAAQKSSNCRKSKINKKCSNYKKKVNYHILYSFHCLISQIDLKIY